MARYKVAFEQTPYGTAHRRLSTVSHIRSLAARDGANFVWTRPDGHTTRAYHGSLRFSFNVALQLQHTEPGDLSHFSTRVDDVQHAERTYRVLTLHSVPPRTPGQSAYERAMGELGTPYRFGAANGPDDVGADSFDCSGLTMWAWEPWASLPHSAEAQRTASNVSLFTEQEHADRGDLVFMWFPNTRGILPGHASHVGLWSKDGWMLDTRSTTEPVAVRPIELGNVVAFGRVRA